VSDQARRLAVLPTERSCPLHPADELQALRGVAEIVPLSFPGGDDGWVVASHAAARAVLTDSRFGQCPGTAPAGDPSRVVAAAEFRKEPIWLGSMVDHNPPQHNRLRRPQAGFFTPQRLASFETAIREICSERLDAMEAAGSPVDFVETFTSPFASTVLCAVLEIPTEERTKFLRITDVSTFEFTEADFDELREYMYEIVRQKTKQPGSDVLSHLVGLGELSADELAGSALKLFTAGHDTTSMQLASSMYALLAPRSHWESLVADTSLIGSATEELLRFCTISQWMPETRVALEDVELAGIVIKAGEPVTIALPTANRDPGRYENPDDLDLTRNAAGHLAFGFGRHICLGQHLVRLEMRIALEGLISRFPTLHLAVPPEEVEPRPAQFSISGVRRLPVSW
jgi:cytochrome P450